MGIFTRDPADVFAPTDANGTVRGADMGETQTLMVEMGQIVNGLALTQLIKATKALLDADLAHATDTMAVVFNDSTKSNNGYYQKSGASGSGSWTRIADLPYSFIKATNAGAGTANAIVATTPTGVPSADGGALIALPIIATNTASPVTVAFDGSAALTIKTAAGNDVAIGGLVAGIIGGYKFGTTFRLLSDQSSAAVQAAAENAATSAQNYATIAQGMVATLEMRAVATRSAMALLSVTAGTPVILTEDVPSVRGRFGRFVATDSDISALITRDPQQGVAVPKASDTTGASGGFVRTCKGDEVDTTWFGAKGDNTTNDLIAIQAAYDFFNSGRGTIHHPGGTYFVSGGAIAVRNNHIHTRGDGSGVTVFRMGSSADFDTLFSHEAADAASIITGGSYRDFSFYSLDTTHKKIGLRLVDHSNLVVKNVTTVDPHWFGGSGSFGIIEYGRELAVFEGITLFADKPIYLNGPAPGHTGSGIGIDQHAFRDIYLCNLVSDNPLITIESGTVVSQLKFTGYLALVGGTHGIYFADGLNAATCNGLTIEDVRFEQGRSSISYMIYISTNTALQELVINRGQGGDRRGFYLRNVQGVTISDFWYENATGIALDVDATVKKIRANNCFWQAGSTANIVGQRLVYATPKNPATGALPPTFTYDEAANTLTATTINQIIGGSYSLADGATASIAAEIVAGAIVTSSNSNAFALVALRGSAHTTAVVSASDAGVYSNTKDNVGTINVYWESADSTYHVQNKSGVSTVLTVTPFGQ